MAAEPQRQEAPTNDLFGRWLAHHEQQSGDTTGSSEGTPNPEPQPSRRLPTAAVASSALQRDPLIGSRIAPPSTFGARRPAANAPQRSGGVNELDRESTPGWEPIVMRSVRTRAEKEESKKTPKPEARPSRLQRLKARLVDPTPGTSDEAGEATADEPLATTPPALPTPLLPTSPLPGRATAPQPAPLSIEETIRAAVAPAERVVARHAQPVEPPAPIEPVVARHAQRVEPPASVEPPAPVEPVVARHSHPVAPFVPEEPEEPEELAAPRPVRAFIDAPRFVEPAPYVAPEPEPVAVQPEPEPEPEPAAYVVPEPEPEPAAYVAPEPEPVAVEPVRVEPVVVEPVVVEPVVVEPVVVEPVVVEPVVVEPVVVLPVVVEPTIEPAPVREPEPVARVTEIEPTAPKELHESGPTEEPEEPAARRSLLPRSLRQLKEAKAPKEPKEPRGAILAARATTSDAARDLVAAKARDRAAFPARYPLPEVPPVAPAAVEVEVEATPEPEPEAAPAPHKASKHDEVATQMPGVYKFASKRTARRVLTIAFLIGAVISAYFVRAALAIKDTPSIGLATIAVLATATVWAIRAGASVTKLEVHMGQLEVVQQGQRFIFDLASQYTAVEVHGVPGRRGWKVLFPRRGMAPFRVDATMVDPDDFMRVLRFFRPQLVNH